MSTDLTDRVAIVTGASSGIGAAVARELAEAGMRLVITGRRREKLEALADELAGECAVVAGDMTDEDMPPRLLATAVEGLGRCDVVFNNAGVMEVGSIEKADVDKLCRMVRVNVEAVYRLAYHALKHFIARGSGHLLNVSSVLGTKVRPTTGAYAGTKYAVEALTEALRMETAGSRVRVGLIEPGLVETGLQDHFEQHPRDVLSIRQMLAPADIACGVRFMLEQPAHVNVPVMMMLPSEQSM